MTELGEAFDIATERYKKHFGNYYPLMWGASITEELIADIYRCIETNTEAKKPVYEDGVDY